MAALAKGKPKPVADDDDDLPDVDAIGGVPVAAKLKPTPKPKPARKRGRSDDDHAGDADDVDTDDDDADDADDDGADDADSTTPAFRGSHARPRKAKTDHDHDADADADDDGDGDDGDDDDDEGDEDLLMDREAFVAALPDGESVLAVYAQANDELHALRELSSAACKPLREEKDVLRKELLAFLEARGLDAVKVNDKFVARVKSVRQSAINAELLAKVMSDLTLSQFRECLDTIEAARVARVEAWRKTQRAAALKTLRAAKAAAKKAEKAAGRGGRGRGGAGGRARGRGRGRGSAAARGAVMARAMADAAAARGEAAAEDIDGVLRAAEEVLQSPTPGPVAVPAGVEDAAPTVTVDADADTLEADIEKLIAPFPPDETERFRRMRGGVMYPQRVAPPAGRPLTRREVLSEVLYTLVAKRVNQPSFTLAVRAVPPGGKKAYEASQAAVEAEADADAGGSGPTPSPAAAVRVPKIVDAAALDDADKESVMERCLALQATQAQLSRLGADNAHKRVALRATVKACEPRLQAYLKEADPETLKARRAMETAEGIRTVTVSSVTETKAGKKLTMWDVSVIVDAAVATAAAVFGSKLDLDAPFDPTRDVLELLTPPVASCLLTEILNRTANVLEERLQDVSRVKIHRGAVAPPPAQDVGSL
jgi:hypothetical protein